MTKILSDRDKEFIWVTSNSTVNETIEYQVVPFP